MQRDSQFSLGRQDFDITPPIGVYLAGFASRTLPSDGITHPLQGAVVALGDHNTTVLFICLEWLGFYDLTEPIREQCFQATGIPRDHIFCCASHTHNGPVLPRKIDIERHGNIDYDYFERMQRHIASAAQAAVSAQKPVHLDYAIGWCGFSASRRRPLPDGGVVWQPTLDAAHDHRVPVLCARTPKGDIDTILFSYACHPTGAGDTRQIGGGYVSYALDAIKEHYPHAVAAFLQGGGGDQKPFALDPKSGDFRRLSIDEVSALGQRLGQSVVHAIGSPEHYRLQPPLCIKHSLISLDTETPSTEQLQQALSAPHSHVKRWAAFHLRLRKNKESPDTKHPFEIQILCFGRDLALIALSGEITNELALFCQHRAEKFIDRALIVGYANQITGYIPAAAQYEQGGYEIWDSNQIHLYSGPFVRQTQDQISAEIERILKSSAASD